VKKNLPLPSAITAMPDPAPEAATGRRFLRTQFANIKRDSVSGTLHIRATVCGLPLRKSLHTKSVTIAKSRADEKLAAAHAAWQHKSKRPDVDRWRMRQLTDFWLVELTESSLKQTTKTHRRDLVKIIRANWPDFDALKPSRVTTADCESWRRRMLRADYSPSTINHCIEILRSIFAKAAGMGMVFSNPAREHYDGQKYQMSWIKDLPKSRLLPNRVTWARILKRLRARPDRRRALWRVRMLNYSGQRPLSISHVRPSDVDLKAGVIQFPPIKHNDLWNEIPLNRQLRVVVRTLMRLHPGGNGPLVPVRNARKALATACTEAKFRRMKESDFRHCFTTDAFEKGLSDVAVTAMRGDKPGSNTARRIYTHSRLEHLVAEAAKL
jgi:integrase